MPLAARLKLETPQPEQTPLATPILAAPEQKGVAESAATPEAARPPASPVLTILPEETVFTSAPKNGHGDGGGRPKILQEVVTANSVPQPSDHIAKPAESEAKGDDQQKKHLNLARNGSDAGERGESKEEPAAGTEEVAAAAKATGSDKETPGQERGHAKSDGPKAVPGALSQQATAANGLNHAPYQNGAAAEDLAEVINLDSLNSDVDDEKIGPNLPTLLERLRSIGEDHGEGEKPRRQREA
jgi:hypothetical protein